MTTDGINRRLQFQKSFSHDHRGDFRRKSIILDAKLDKVANEEFERSESNGDWKQDAREFQLLISLEDALDGICSLLDKLKNFEHEIIHLETRPQQHHDAQSTVEVLLILKTTEIIANRFIDIMRGSSMITGVKKVGDQEASKEIWFPKHISDLDNCQHLLLKFEPELTTDHPGFHDKIYRQRRCDIAKLAFDYRFGQPIPHIAYSDEELKTWNTVYTTLKGMFETHSCKEHWNAFQALESAGIFTPDAVPQLENVSNYLKRQTGFSLRPVAGLLSARDFLASLSFRVFQCTQYLRHPSKPLYSPEPDCVHELLGHVPLLTTKEFAEFSQEIGLASLGVSDEDIQKLATLYWFTIEFGICREDGKLRAYGAGLLSSYGELMHALSNVPEHRPFEPEKTAIMQYTDEDYQPVYFVAENFADMKNKMRMYARRIQRPYQLRYDPYTASIEILQPKNSIIKMSPAAQRELDNLQQSLQSLILLN